jgi:small subunit ribosomal protein S6
VKDRTYEIIFIADPNLSEPDVETLTTTVKGFVEKEGGKIEKSENWGKKRLAYEVRRQRDGYYILLTVQGSAALVKEVERRIRVTDGIIRHLSVRVDEELAKAETRKAARAEQEGIKRARQATSPSPSPSPSTSTKAEGAFEETQS